MDIDSLVGLYPRLYHMAAAGSWPSIRSHGLLSTEALLDLWRVSPESVRSQILDQRRPASIQISDPILGAATIRDQLPLDSPSLRSSLTDMTEEEWLRSLNQRVFFFLHPERLSGLLNARSYRNDEQVVIHVDTRSLLAEHLDKVELSPINSGFAQPHNHAARGSTTFRRVEDYAHPRLASRRTAAPWHVAELSVLGGVRDVERHVVKVERKMRDQVLETVFDRET